MAKQTETKIELARCKARQEQEQYMNNFEDFTKFLINHLYKTDILMCYYLFNVPEWYKLLSQSKNDYYICCFSSENYGESVVYDEQVDRYYPINCTREGILKEFTKEINHIKKPFNTEMNQIKRALGLYLEYSLVKEFNLIPNTSKRSTGRTAWDFMLNKEKVDLKICFFEESKDMKNKSIYNRSYTISIYDIKTIFEYITHDRIDNYNENIDKSFKSLLEEIKKTLVTGNN